MARRVALTMLLVAAPATCFVPSRAVGGPRFGLQLSASTLESPPATATPEEAAAAAEESPPAAAAAAPSPSPAGPPASGPLVSAMRAAAMKLHTAPPKKAKAPPSADEDAPKKEKKAPMMQVRVDRGRGGVSGAWRWVGGRWRLGWRSPWLAVPRSRWAVFWFFLGRAARFSALTAQPHHAPHPLAPPRQVSSWTPTRDSLLEYLVDSQYVYAEFERLILTRPLLAASLLNTGAPCSDPSNRRSSPLNTGAPSSNPFESSFLLLFAIPPPRRFFRLSFL